MVNNSNDSGEAEKREDAAAAAGTQAKGPAKQREHRYSLSLPNPTVPDLSFPYRQINQYFYTVAFAEGPLFLEMKPDDRQKPEVCGFSEAPELPRGVGPGERCGRIAMGDTLVAVNKKSLNGLSFDAAIAKFQGSSFPMSLKFHKGTISLKNREIVEWLHAQRKAKSGGRQTGVHHCQAARRLIEDELKSKKKKKGVEFLLKIMCREVSVGFVRSFAEREHSAEHIEFFVAVTLFKETASPGAARRIYEEFIREGAPQQVCLSCAVVQKFEESLNDERADPAMFDQIVKASVRTIYKDIFPRFKRSPEFKELQEHIAKKVELPAIEMDIVTLLDNPEIDIETKKAYTIDEILSDHYLVGLLIEWSKRRISSENVLCWRQIQIFKARFEEDSASTNGVESRQNAWAIFAMFLDDGAPLEVSISSSIRASIGYQVGMPRRNMFDKVEDRVYRCLCYDHFAEFAESDEYTSIPVFLKNIKKERAPEHQSAVCTIS